MIEHVEHGVQAHGHGGAQGGQQQAKRLSTHYEIVCRDRTGALRWQDAFDNLVVTAGLNDSLTQHFKGSSYTAAWYVGLTSATPTVAAGDTMASHAGWTEVVAYDEAARPALTLGTASGGSISNTASPARFTVSTNGTAIGGAFVANNDTKEGTTGTLYGGGALANGNRTLADGDTLDVTITLTAAAG